MKGIIGIIILMFLAAVGTLGGKMGLILTAPATFFAIWLFICHLTSIWTHLENLASVQALKTAITVAEFDLEIIMDLAPDASGLPDNLLALDQKSNPITHHMAMVQRALDRVAGGKNDLARTKALIDVRAIGPFGIVTDVFGKELK